MSSAPSRRWRRLIYAAALLAIVVAAARWFLLPFLGTYIINGEEPFKAPVAVVLAGDQYGYRILRGGELARDGIVDKVLVSGGPWVYGLYESELAIQFAVRNGFDAGYFEALHEEVHSTQEEAHSIVQDLKRRGIRRALVVTNDFHTRRAGKIWRQTAPWMQLRMIAAKDRFFRGATWWQDREAGKHVFTEWSKMAALTFDFFPPPNSGLVPAP